MAEAEKIPLSDATKAKIPSIGQTLEDAGFVIADELIDTGLSVEASTSAVACLMIRAAWVIAATGRLSGGHEPRPEVFRAAVENVLATVEWCRRQENATNEEPCHG